MTFSIKTKLLMMCILLVLVTAVGISASYYRLTKQEKHRESRQRIQIGFDIVFDDYQHRVGEYRAKVTDFLQKHGFILSWELEQYAEDTTQIRSPGFIQTCLSRTTPILEELGALLSADRLMVYAAADTRLISAYLLQDQQATTGVYARSQAGQDTYLPANDPNLPASKLLLREQGIPTLPLPPELPGAYPEPDIPETVQVGLFSNRQQVGIRFVAPISYKGETFGVLVGDILYTPDMVSRYAALSHTELNVLAGQHCIMGTLEGQQDLDLAQLDSCTAIATQQTELRLTSVTFADQAYYQGQCALRNVRHENIGAVTVSLSQAVEQADIRTILVSVLTISGLVVSLALVLSLVFSHRTLRAIQNIVTVIGYAAEGDLRNTATAATHDEIGTLAVKLNQMIAQLRTISGRVQGAASAVNGTAETILRQMEGLMQHMQAQTSSVEATTGSVEQITHFIQAVAQEMTTLLATSDLVLSSIQETQASVEEVTASTETLVANLQLIVVSVAQVSHSNTQISERVEQLDEIARQSMREVQHIDHSFQDVVQNAQQAQALARDTMEAARQGQASVDASMQGINELKRVVADTARIIQDVNAWGGQVSAILDIVGEITEQTSLLALNASIISAQAGVHGRGFAVVAEEIKHLAVRTKSSTQEIGLLVRQLQQKTGEGVSTTAQGLVKADQGVQLATAVQQAFDIIVERAARSSSGAGETVQVIQQTADSSQMISTAMTRVTDMVSHIRGAIQDQEQDMDQVVAAVEAISGMAEQVNRASREQRTTAEQIMNSMDQADRRFHGLSEQTTALQQHAAHIMEAMHAIEATTTHAQENVTSISGDTVQSLVQQSEMLQKLVSLFKIS